MRVLGWISAGLVLVALLIVGGGYLLLPSAASLSRELVIAAPQERVFAMVNSFEHFDERLLHNLHCVFFASNLTLSMHYPGKCPRAKFFSEEEIFPAYAHSWS